MPDAIIGAIVFFSDNLAPSGQANISNVVDCDSYMGFWVSYSKLNPVESKWVYYVILGRTIIQLVYVHVISNFYYDIL